MPAENAVIEPNEDDINYTAEPTPAKFHASDYFVRGIRGPIGSGKTVACCFEVLKRAMEQKPRKGVRRSRWCFIRNTTPELKLTTVKTWMDWFEYYTTITYSTPMTAKFSMEMPDNTRVELELIFLGLDKPKDVKKLKSFELTGAFLNEAMEIPKAILDMATGRVNRYPSKDHGGPTWTGVIMDTNSCDDDHWWYKIANDVPPLELPHNWKFFDQPAALLKRGSEYIPNPKAENIRNLMGGYDYYLNMLGGKTQEWIAVFILNEYGTIAEGKPVYPEYQDSIHCSKERIRPIPNLSIVLGWDYGLTPACAICQLTPLGQFRILEELLVDSHGGMGVRQFATRIVRPHLLKYYMDWVKKGLVESYGDPVGSERAQTDETTALMVLDDVFNNPKGLDEMPMDIITTDALTNSPLARTDAVRKFLIESEDRERGLKVSPNCRFIRKGFRGSYMYNRVQVSGQHERYQDKPLKNIYSHIADGVQYAALMVRVLKFKERPKESSASRRIRWLENPDSNDFEDYATKELETTMRLFGQEEYDFDADGVYEDQDWEGEGGGGDLVETIG